MNKPEATLYALKHAVDDKKVKEILDDLRSKPDVVKVIVEFDFDCENPLLVDDGRWSLAFCGHPAPHGYQVEHSPEDLLERHEAKLAEGLAFKVDYSDELAITSYSPTGVIYWGHDPSDMGAKTIEDRRQDAQNEIDEFNTWLKGECYSYDIIVGGCRVGHSGGYIGDDQFLDNAVFEIVSDISYEMGLVGSTNVVVVIDGAARWPFKSALESAFKEKGWEVTYRKDL
jgi:hypothetical protein